MSIKRIVAAASIMMMAVTLPAQASSGTNRASTTVRIQGFVPVICRVQLSTTLSTPNEDGVASLGVADEFCNAPRGYRVVVQHAENLEGAALISDGQRIPLSASGETVLTNSNHPDLRKVALAIDLGENAGRFNALGLRIEAKS